jgi:AcrR family transcriptional regulator
MPDGSGRKNSRARARSADAERTRLDIIEAARAEFVEKGLTGASVNDIAARTRTTKPMIYYYFGSKEKLYLAVMEEAYGAMREVERNLALEHLSPQQAIRRLIEVTFDYHAAHPDYPRLISIENIHGARHIADTPSIARRNQPIIEILSALLRRGEEAGVFRKGVDPVDLHLLINSFCFYRISNRHTWRTLFGRDPDSPENAVAQRRMIVESVLRYLDPAGGPDADKSDARPAISSDRGGPR